MLVNIAVTPTTNTRQDRRHVRRAEARVDFGEARRKQPVARHREEDPRLAELEHEQHRRVRDDRAEGDDAHRTDFRDR